MSCVVRSGAHIHAQSAGASRNVSANASDRLPSFPDAPGSREENNPRSVRLLKAASLSPKGPCFTHATVFMSGPYGTRYLRIAATDRARSIRFCRTRFVDHLHDRVRIVGAGYHELIGEDEGRNTG